MASILHFIKPHLEKATGIRFFRDSLPHGADLFRDLGRKFPIHNFKVVFDVGANEGQTISIFQKSFPKATIHAFEPVSKLFKNIGSHVTLSPTTHLHQLALGDIPGKATINVRNNQTSSLIESPVEDHEYREEVEVSTIDAFTTRFSVSKIDYLKIDAEGFDLNVLKGAKGLLQDGRIDFIQVEAGFSQHWRTVVLNDFINYLHPQGFEMFGLYDQIPHWTGEPWLICVNAIFIHRRLAGKQTCSP